MDLVDIPGGAIRLRRKGAGPPLVLLSTLAGGWMRQVPELSRDFTVITYDMRGFGGSPSDRGFPTNAEHAADLAALLDRLDLPRATVVGQSHGGLVAQHFAAGYPGRLAGLGLVATFSCPHGPTRLLLRMLHGFLERDDLANFWQVLRAFLFTADGAELLARRETALKQAMFDQYDTAALRSIYGQAIEHDSSGWFAAVDCPALVVGGAQDMLFPPELTERLAAEVPGARLELLPAAHVPPVEAHRDVNRLVRETFR